MKNWSYIFNFLLSYTIRAKSLQICSILMKRSFFEHISETVRVFANFFFDLAENVMFP